MKILLNKEFYSLEAIKEAAEDFSHIADFRILNDKIEVEMKPKVNIDEPIDSEFCNYVLGLMKNKELV